MEMANRLMTTELRKNRPKNFLLSVVIPCFNEEEVITNLYYRIIDVLGTKHFQLQMIFVDDGSKDQTGNILAQIAAEDNRVKTSHSVTKFWTSGCGQCWASLFGRRCHDHH